MPSSRKSTEKSRPLPVSAELVVVSEAIVGEKSSRSQPVALSGLGGNELSCTVVEVLNHCGGVGFFPEAASTPETSGFSQLRCKARKGTSARRNEQSFSPVGHLAPSESVDVSAGLPHTVSFR